MDGIFDFYTSKTISRYKYGTFSMEFLHTGAVKMLDIKYTRSLLCVEVKYTTTHSQELLSKVFLQYLKYGAISRYKYGTFIVEFLHSSAVKCLISSIVVVFYVHKSNISPMARNYWVMCFYSTSNIRKHAITRYRTFILAFLHTGAVEKNDNKCFLFIIGAWNTLMQHILFEM